MRVLPRFSVGVDPFQVSSDEALARLRKVLVLDAVEAALAPAVTPPACSFCGGPKATQEIATGLRCQAETWHVCHRSSCNETIPYHRERLEAGLVDCGETRADTWRWTKERLGVK